MLVVGLSMLEHTNEELSLPHPEVVIADQMVPELCHHTSRVTKQGPMELVERLFGAGTPNPDKWGRGILPK